MYNEIVFILVKEIEEGGLCHASISEVNRIQQIHQKP